jgi:hypothetical protein
MKVRQVPVWEEVDMPSTGQRYNVNQYSVNFLLGLIESGSIAIPEIQRPFVWNSAKVRNLMDSLYQGYPVGYLIGWKNPDVRLKDGTLANGKRITAMMEALAGKSVTSKSYRPIRIRIAFHPLEEKFEVHNSAIAKNSEWIPDIAQTFSADGDLFKIVRGYCEKNPDADENRVFAALSALKSITNHQIGFIDLAHDLDIETVTEIFIRVNSAGVTLNQADFAMSKISVNETYGGNALRKGIDYFCQLAVHPAMFESIKRDEEFQATEYFSRIAWLRNEAEYLWDPSYSDVLRVAFTSEFHRGRLADLVALLSGRNFDTRTYEEAIVEDSFARLKQGFLTFANETRFKDLMMIIKSAGFVEPGMIGSSNAIAFAYILYHLLKKKDVYYGDIHKYVRRWFVMSLLTARHSGSFETRFEQDARMIMQGDPLTYIDQVFAGELSDAFWNVVLPQRLVSSSGNNQYFHIFTAALVRGHDKGFLSSDIDVETLVKIKSDLHHIFPKAYLQKQGYVQAQYNQIANYAIAQSEINVRISNKEPAQYMAEVRAQAGSGAKSYGSIIDPQQLAENLSENCIPEMIYTATSEDYPTFLEQRRKLMAAKIRSYFEGLA